jgi:hypothetical protein
LLFRQIPPPSGDPRIFIKALTPIQNCAGVAEFPLLPKGKIPLHENLKLSQRNPEILKRLTFFEISTHRSNYHPFFEE